jgi:hypothetical protein
MPTIAGLKTLHDLTIAARIEITTVKALTKPALTNPRVVAANIKELYQHNNVYLLST